MKQTILSLSLAVQILILRNASTSVYAATDAFRFAVESSAIGYYDGGLGWGFVPKSDIDVTWVGYANTYSADGQALSNATVRFWDSSHTTVATYPANDLTISDFQHTNTLVYGQVPPLRLKANRLYFVTLDLGMDSRGSNAPLVTRLYSPDLATPAQETFSPASELTYAGICKYDQRQGVLQLFKDSEAALFLGPTFRFESAYRGPALSLRIANGKTLISWSTNAPSFSPETAAALTDTTWNPISEPPTIEAGNYVVAMPKNTSPCFVRLKTK